MHYLQSQPIRTTILAILSALGASITHALGGWDITLQVLISFLAADYLTGLVLAAVFQNSPASVDRHLSIAVELHMRHVRQHRRWQFQFMCQPLYAANPPHNALFRTIFPFASHTLPPSCQFSYLSFMLLPP